MSHGIIVEVIVDFKKKGDKNKRRGKAERY